jgi:serine/threonine protein kinase
MAPLQYERDGYMHVRPLNLTSGFGANNVGMHLVRVNDAMNPQLAVCKLLDPPTVTSSDSDEEQMSVNDEDTMRPISAACSTLKKDEDYEKEEGDETEQREVAIMKLLNHPNIINYTGYARAMYDGPKHSMSLKKLTLLQHPKDRLYMEYCDGGSLADIINLYRAADKLVPEMFIWHVLDSLLRALMHLQAQSTMEDQLNERLACATLSGPRYVGRTKKRFEVIAGDEEEWVSILHSDLYPDNILLTSQPFESLSTRILCSIPYENTLTEDISPLPAHNYPRIVLADFGEAELHPVPEVPEDQEKQEVSNLINRVIRPLCGPEYTIPPGETFVEFVDRDQRWPYSFALLTILEKWQFPTGPAVMLYHEMYESYHEAMEVNDDFDWEPLV